MLIWKKVTNVDNEIAYMERAEYTVEGTPFTFDVVQYKQEGRQYYIHIYNDEDYFYNTGMGEFKNRAKHAAENYLKLVMSGRKPRSIRMRELEIGWESFIDWKKGKRHPHPDFIPIVIDGKLVKPD